ncbi:hypothetical protein CGZ93_06015 [Enemella dayhoffiae]|uniref:Bacterial Ig domain-containing protein n=1 Tax=Enemella dayhoffiae TaxID=2016507 RepID=A0A255H8F6_9ACTN|nr:hypothetical protein [Enemella dayhoffiae]OYO23493.1 hypothetical protein CGZ93_06015 [Enemella dayhoffiae]
MKTRIVWGTAVLTAALGTLLVAPAAIAAPTAGPTPSAAATPAKVTPSAKATTTAPSARATATPTATPSQAQSRNLKVQVQAPSSATAPAVLTVTGARPGSTVSASAGRNDQAQAEAIGSATADASGRAVIRLAPPGGRWPAGATYRYGVGGENAGDGQATGSFRTPGSASNTGSVSMQPPATSSDPVRIRVKGLKPGTRLSVSAGREELDEDATSTEATVGADGTVEITLPAPTGGWVPGARYSVGVGEQGGSEQGWVGHFTAPGRGSTAPVKTPNESTGGLAKTGA